MLFDPLLTPDEDVDVGGGPERNLLDNFNFLVGERDGCSSEASRTLLD